MNEFGALAQSVEHLTFNQVVAGSIPACFIAWFGTVGPLDSVPFAFSWGRIAAKCAKALLLRGLRGRLPPQRSQNSAKLSQKSAFHFVTKSFILLQELVL